MTVKIRIEDHFQEDPTDRRPVKWVYDTISPGPTTHEASGSQKYGIGDYRQYERVLRVEKICVCTKIKSVETFSSRLSDYQSQIIQRHLNLGAKDH